MKFIKTLAFTSLFAFTALAFTACDGTKSSDAVADTTAVMIDDAELLIDETVDDASNMMKAAVDSTAAGTEAAVEEATK